MNSTKIKVGDQFRIVFPMYPERAAEIVTVTKLSKSKSKHEFGSMLIHFEGRITLPIRVVNKYIASGEWTLITK